MERFVVVVFSSCEVQVPKLFGGGGTLRSAIRAIPYRDVPGYARLRRNHNPIFQLEMRSNRMKEG